VKEINQFRKYDFNSVRDLIRLIRNKVNHFHEIPKETRNSIGKTPEAFVEYILKLYPKLLSFAFVYAKKKKWKLYVQLK
jgi:serine/threonine-protein kinase/endoribonuclease IRE1